MAYPGMPRDLKHALRRGVPDALPAPVARHRVGGQRCDRCATGSAGKERS